MRELARFLRELHATDFSPHAQHSDFIKPGKFDVVVSTVKSLLKFESLNFKKVCRELLPLHCLLKLAIH